MAKNKNVDSSIVDPNTGAGAYLINGGANGAYVNGQLIGSSIGIAFLIFDESNGASSVAATDAIVLALSFTIGLLIGTIFNAVIYEWEDKEWGCFGSGILTGFATVALAGSLGKGVANGFNKIILSAISKAFIALGLKLTLDETVGCLS